MQLSNVKLAFFHNLYVEVIWSVCNKLAFLPILLVLHAGALSVFQTPALTRSGNPSKAICLVACITFTVYAAKLPVSDGRLP